MKEPRREHTRDAVRQKGKEVRLSVAQEVKE